MEVDREKALLQLQLQQMLDSQKGEVAKIDKPKSKKQRKQKARCYHHVKI